MGALSILGTRILGAKLRQIGGVLPERFWCRHELASNNCSRMLARKRLFDRLVCRRRDFDNVRAGIFHDVVHVHAM
jgi:hypothetical protein